MWTIRHSKNKWNKTETGCQLKPCWHDRLQTQQAFTLIELLIVIVIISIVASFATLSIHINQNKKLESISNQLANTFKLAEQEAMLRSVTFGFVLTKNSFQFYEFHPAKKPDENPWHISTDNMLRAKHIPENVNMTLKMRGETITDTSPKLIISPSGEITPFRILIGKKGASPKYEVVGNANGEIKSIGL